MRGICFECISKMWVPGLQEKSRLPGDSNTCRTGPGLEVNQEPCWCESVLTAVPRHHVSVRVFFFRVHANPMMAPAKRQKAVTMELAVKPPSGETGARGEHYPGQEAQKRATK